MGPATLPGSHKFFHQSHAVTPQTTAGCGSAAKNCSPACPGPGIAGEDELDAPDLVT
jgi:hypothetical protein